MHVMPHYSTLEPPHQKRCISFASSHLARLCVSHLAGDRGGLLWRRLSRVGCRHFNPRSVCEERMDGVVKDVRTRRQHCVSSSCDVAACPKVCLDDLPLLIILLLGVNQR